MDSTCPWNFIASLYFSGIGKTMIILFYSGFLKRLKADIIYWK